MAADPKKGAPASGGGGGNKSSCSRLLAASLLVPVILVPALSVIVSYALPAPPPTDFGTGSMFDQIAPRYDFINRALALNLDTGWRRRMVNEVTDGGELFRRGGGGGGGGARVLDLATGTADVALLIGEAAAVAAGESNSEASIATAEVLGVDPSANMIDVGRKKVSDRDMSDIITLEIGDARNLQGLKDSYFDAATMSFGIRNVPERDVALCEIYRVIKKPGTGGEGGEGGGGGKLGILEFSEPDPKTGILPSLARLFIRHVVPVVGAALSGAPREYMHLQNSIKEFPTPAEFRKEMEGLECGNEGGRKGTFIVDDVVNMNFGSVQLYLARPVVR